MPDWKPSGWPTVAPRLFVKDEAQLVDFMRQAPGAEGEVHAGRPAEMRLGDSVVMVSNVAARGGVGACLYVYVPDVDATYEAAMRHGVRSIETPRDLPYGDRRCMVEDPSGTTWQIATRRSTPAHSREP